MPWPGCCRFGGASTEVATTSISFSESKLAAVCPTSANWSSRQLRSVLMTEATIFWNGKELCLWWTIQRTTDKQCDEQDKLCVATDQLLPLVYDELRKLAAAKLANEKPGQTLEATALVHEAYMRLVDTDKAWDSRGHFFGATAEAMRRIVNCHLPSRVSGLVCRPKSGSFHRRWLRQSATPGGRTPHGKFCRHVRGG